jgi:hypothetical protein
MHIIQFTDNSVLDTSFATIDQVLEWMQTKWEGREPSLSIKTKFSDRLPGVIEATFLSGPAPEGKEERKIVAKVFTLRKSKHFLSPGEQE